MLKTDGATPPARPRDLQALGFERRPMVRWLSPRTLVDAAVRVVLSSWFGQFADKRELQAALDPQPGPPLTYGPGDEVDGGLWFDFVADLGDGFDATYAVASLLAPERLEVGGEALPRGRLLVMGGDEVYPDPSRDGYEHRLRGPYAAAFPWTSGRQADLLAIPGNHDWYDGLTNFLRIFCAGRSFGGWRTRQRRSYWAVRLPHRWWLLGVDIQLDTYIDTPQLEYFRNIGLQEGDRVVLVTGKPSWTKVESGGVLPDSFKNLHYFEENVVRAAGAEVRATLTGDTHHYARHAADDGRQWIIAGGGGAYLAGTHTIHKTLDLPSGEARLQGCFPDSRTSSRLARGAWRLPWHAQGLAGILGVTHALLAGSLFGVLTAAGGWWVALAALAALLAAALVGYSGVPGRAGRVLSGLAHAGVHGALAAAPALVAAEALGAEGLLAALGVMAVAAVTGFALGGIAFGLYLWALHRVAPNHANEALACQAIPDFKHFLRIRLDAGGLTIHPIGLRRVPRAWEPAPDDPPEAPWLRPADGPLQPELIERPVHVPDDRVAGGGDPVGAATAS